MMNPAGGVACDAVSGTNKVDVEVVWKEDQDVDEAKKKFQPVSGQYKYEYDYLMKFLRCGQCQAGGHVCTIAYSTVMQNDLPAGSNFESICIPGHSELCSETNKGLTSIARSLTITLHHKNFVNDL